MIYAPNYSKDIFDPKTFPWLVDCTVKAVTEFERRVLNGAPIEALAFSGHSGLLVPAVAYALKKPFFAVRQRGALKHDNRSVNGPLTPGLRYLVVDDFIASGDTVQHIITELDNNLSSFAGGVRPRPVGVLEHYAPLSSNLVGQLTSTRMFYTPVGNFELPVVLLDTLVPEYAELKAA